MATTVTGSVSAAVYDQFTVRTRTDPKVLPASGENGNIWNVDIGKAESEILNLIALSLEGVNALEVRNQTGGALAAGTLVYVSGYASSRWLVSKAQADDDTKLAQFVLSASISNNANGLAYAFKTITGLDTSGRTVNDPVYLSDTPGAFAFAAGTIPQVVGKVETVHASTGTIWFHVGGANRGISDHGALSGLTDADHVAGSIAFTATDKLLGRSTSGAGAGEEISCTAAGRALLDDATAGDQLTTLGLSANGKSLVTAANYAAMRALLDLEAGTDFLSPAAIAAAYQPLDTQLTSLAGLSYTSNALKVVRVNAGETAFELATISGVGIENVVEDTTPQLGGNLDTNGFDVSFDTGKGILDENGNEQLIFSTTTDAINYVVIQNADITAFDPLITVDGTGTNIDLELDGKGTGKVIAHFGSSGLRLWDVDDGSHYMYINVENLSGNRQLRLDIGDANRAFTIGADSSISGTAYVVGGTDVALADGGTGASLSDPGADRIMFWDDSAGAVTWLTVGSGLSITDTTISATGGGTIDGSGSANALAKWSDSDTLTSASVLDDGTNVTMGRLYTRLGTNYGVDGSSKTAYLECATYNDAANDSFTFAFLSGSSGSNFVYIGGNGGINAATRVSIYTGATSTTADGSERLRIDNNGNIVPGTAALATTDTNGWTYIQSCPGLPTGVPAGSYSGRMPLVWDSTNDRLYVYDGSWVQVGGSGGGDMPPITLLPTGNEPPSASYATLDLRNGHPVLDFDGTADEEAVWTAVLPASYAGGGLTVQIFVSFTSATSGTAGFQVAIERINASGLDIDSDSFVAFNGANVSVPGTSGHVVVCTVTFTDGADMDSLAAGELFRLKLRRDADGTTQTDDVTTDAEVLAVVVKET